MFLPFRSGYIAFPFHDNFISLCIRCNQPRARPSTPGPLPIPHSKQPCPQQLTGDASDWAFTRAWYGIQTPIRIKSFAMKKN